MTADGRGTGAGAHHTLRVRCRRWDQVENFYAKRIRPGKRFIVRVPFSPQLGDPVTLTLELPNDIDFAIDGEVMAVAKSRTDPKKSAVEIELHGFTPQVRARLEQSVASARDSAQGGPPMHDARGDDAMREVTAGHGDRDIPSAQPVDAPVCEDVVLPQHFDAAAVSGDDREVFEALDRKFSALTECSVYDVLGVSAAADIATIRAAYLELTRRYHPDRFARHRNAAVAWKVQELFILINKAYDRLRDARVSRGGAMIAGPALLPRIGWLVELEDIADAAPAAPVDARHLASPADDGAAVDEAPDGRRPRSDSQPIVRFRPDSELDNDKLFADVEFDSQVGNRALTSDEQGQQLAREAAELLATLAPREARYRLAQLLNDHPRNRVLRAFYHVAAGYLAIEEGDRAKATAQFETALAHDRDCTAAREALGELQKVGSSGKGLFKRLFR